MMATTVSETSSPYSAFKTTRVITLEDLRVIVANDRKGRFRTTQEGPQVLIRATRGHSLHHVRDDELYTEINATDDVSHPAGFPLRVCNM